MVTGSRSSALPPGSASRQKPDPSARHIQKVPDPDMARQPDDKTAVKSKSDDSALIRELALLLDETNLTEIEIERAGLRVRVARNISIAASLPPGAQPAAAAPPTIAAAPTLSPAAPRPRAAQPAPAAAPAIAAAPADVDDIAKHPGVVPSPMVGT